MDKGKSWPRSVNQFLDQKGAPPAFTHAPFHFDGNRVLRNNQPFAEFNHKLQIAVFLGWTHSNESGGYLATYMMSLATWDVPTCDYPNQANDFRIPVADWAFVPVLSLNPHHHELNIHYLNDMITIKVKSVLRQKVRLGQKGINYRKAERTLPAYLKFHGLEAAYTPPTFEQRVDALKLGKSYVGFIGRRLQGA